MDTKWKAFFLREFTRELILNSTLITNETANKKNINKTIRDNISEKEFEKIKEELAKYFDIKQLQPTDQAQENIKFAPSILPTQPAQLSTQITPQPFQFQLQKQPTKLTPQFSQPAQPQPLTKQQQPQIRPEQIENPLQAVLGVLRDPRVIALECPGPNKFLLVKTATKVMLTRIKLREEQIKQIIESFSKETKIPIISGLFRAMKDNLIITAVISEVAGSRFIIKKVYSQEMF